MTSCVATTCLKTGQSGIPAELTALVSETSLLLLFGGSRLIDRPALIQQVLDACPRSHVMGCSTAGEIHGCEISDDSLVVAAARFDHTALRTAQATVQAPTDSYTAGCTIAEQLTHSSLRGVFVLSDGLYVNGSELVKGLNDTLGGAVVVTGGLAGDGTDFKRTWVIKDRMPIGGYVSILFIVLFFIHNPIMSLVKDASVKNIIVHEKLVNSDIGLKFFGSLNHPTEKIYREEANLIIRASLTQKDTFPWNSGDSIRFDYFLEGDSVTIPIALFKRAREKYPRFREDIIAPLERVFACDCQDSNG